MRYITSASLSQLGQHFKENNEQAVRTASSHIQEAEDCGLETEVVGHSISSHWILEGLALIYSSCQIKKTLQDLADSVSVMEREGRGTSKLFKINKICSSNGASLIIYS